MTIKQQSEFTEKDKLHFVAELWNDITCYGKEFRLEVTSSDVPLLSGGEHEFYAHTAIWDHSNIPAKLVYHNLYKQALTEEQCLDICNNIGENPGKFIK